MSAHGEGTGDLGARLYRVAGRIASHLRPGTKLDDQQLAVVELGDQQEARTPDRAELATL